LATAAPPVRHAGDKQASDDDPTDPDKPRGSIRLVS